MSHPAKTLGSSNPKSKTKTKTNITKSKARNLTNAEQAIIHLRIIELLQNNHTMPQVRKIIKKETGKAPVTVNRYINAATAQLMKDVDRDIATKRLEMITSLRKDVDIAFARYLEKDSLKWFNAYQAVKAKLMSLEPNELKAPDEVKESVTTYTFNFNEISGEQDDGREEDKESK